MGWATGSMHSKGFHHRLAKALDEFVFSNYNGIDHTHPEAYTSAQRCRLACERRHRHIPELWAVRGDVEGSRQLARRHATPPVRATRSPMPESPRGESHRGLAWAPSTGGGCSTPQRSADRRESVAEAH